MGRWGNLGTLHSGSPLRPHSPLFGARYFGKFGRASSAHACFLKLRSTPWPGGRLSIMDSGRPKLRSSMRMEPGASQIALSGANGGGCGTELIVQLRSLSVRFTPESRHAPGRQKCLLSANGGHSSIRTEHAFEDEKGARTGHDRRPKFQRPARALRISSSKAYEG